MTDPEIDNIKIWRLAAKPRTRPSGSLTGKVRACGACGEEVRDVER